MRRISFSSNRARTLGPRFFFAVLAAGLVVTSGAPTTRADAGLKPSTTSASSAAAKPTGKLGSGLEALERAEYSAAEADLKAVSGKDAARAQAALARAAYEQGRFAEAESLAKKAEASAGADRVAKFDALGWRAQAMLAVGKVADVVKLVDPVRDEVEAPRARAALVEALVRSGDRDEANKAADALEADSEGDSAVYTDPAALACVGRAAFLVRHRKYANQTLQLANRQQKKHVETNAVWARLYLDSYDPGHAEESVRDLLATAPNHPWGHLLNAEVKLAQNLDWDGAEKEIAAALKVNPNLSRAYFLRASIALHDLEIKQADDAIKQGLAIDPNELDLLSLRAAARFLDDDLAGYAKAKGEVFSRNAKYSQFYVTVGEFADWEHRYDDLVTMMTEATKLDPLDGKAWAELGFNLLRRGDEKEGRKALDEAWKHDKYNVRLFNMLNLFERTIDKQYELFDGTGQAKPFRFRFEKEEGALLGRYVPKTLGKAWDSMVKRYGFTPVNPVQIEVFPEREHFQVRTDGLPNVGATGVCFGRVITAVSPKKESSNWGLVLWHELGHVFAIQLSKNHVPRWFTEGLSEYETLLARPEWRRNLDPQLYLGLVAGRLPKVANMNRAFTHAKSQGEIIVAYYASSQMVVYIGETYGFPKIVEMLKLWGQGRKSVDVIKSALGVSADDLDAGFRTWARKRLARYDGQFMFDPEALPAVAEAEAASKAAPNDAGKHATLAAAYFLERKFKEADAEAAAALKLDPKSLLAHYIAAKLAFGLRKDFDEAKTHAQAIAAGADGYVAENMLADIAEVKKDKAAVRAALEKAAAFDPWQIDPLLDLYQLAEQEKRDDDALALLRKITKIEPHERAPWHRLMAGLAKKRAWDELVSVGESAVFVDVYAAEIHALYARALTFKGRYADAHDEIDAGLALHQKPENEALLRVELARVLAREKQLPKAREALAQAMKLDPKNPDAAALAGELK